MSIIINPHAYLSPSLLREAFRLLVGLKLSFPARSCSLKRKPGGLKSSPLGIYSFFHLKEINKSKRRSLGCRLRLNEQELAQK